jgi:hypothetical protein
MSSQGNPLEAERGPGDCSETRSQKHACFVAPMRVVTQTEIRDSFFQMKKHEFVPCSIGQQKFVICFSKQRNTNSWVAQTCLCLDVKLGEGVWIEIRNAFVSFFVLNDGEAGQKGTDAG